MKKENVQEETSEEREKRLERAFLDIQEAGYDEGYDDAEQGEPRRTELS